MKKIEWLNNHKDEIYRLYSIYKCCWKIAKHFKVGNSTITKFIKENKPELFKLKRDNCLQYAQKRRKHTCNTSYFTNIDSHDKAYILGFIFADGHNNTKNGILQIGIHKKDIAVLLFIKERMNCSHKIKEEKDTNIIKLYICSRQISNDLKHLGCHSDKTFSATFPNIEEQFKNSFLLGLFDGDGCITILKHCNAGSLSFCGYDSFLQEINNYLVNVLNIKRGCFSKDNRCDQRISNLRYGTKKDILKIRDFFYKDAPFFLERKFNKFSLLKV